MARVTFVDTSVLLNVLDVPNRNADRARIRQEWPRRAEAGQMILPLTTVIEAGNHISHIGDGRIRRDCAGRFVAMLDTVVRGEAPFVLHEMAWDGDFLTRLVGGGTTAVAFVEHLASGSIGCGDLTILVERDRYLERVARGSTAEIWTLDQHLDAYN